MHCDLLFSKSIYISLIAVVIHLILNLTWELKRYYIRSWKHSPSFFSQTVLKKIDTWLTILYMVKFVYTISCSAVAAEHSSICLLLSLRFRSVASFVQTGISNREETQSKCFASIVLGLNVKCLLILFFLVYFVVQLRRTSETSISPPGSSISSPSRVICVSSNNCPA